MHSGFNSNKGGIMSDKRSTSAIPRHLMAGNEWQPGSRLVWIRGTGGEVVPEKWPADAPKGVIPVPEEKGGRVVLQEHPLDKVRWGMSLMELALMYPYQHPDGKRPTTGESVNGRTTGE
jgi:hypothetical protein